MPQPTNTIVTDLIKANSYGSPLFTGIVVDIEPQNGSLWNPTASPSPASFALYMRGYLDLYAAITSGPSGTNANNIPIYPTVIAAYANLYAYGDTATVTQRLANRVEPTGAPSPAGGMVYISYNNSPSGELAESSNTISQMLPANSYWVGITADPPPTPQSYAGFSQPTFKADMMTLDSLYRNMPTSSPTPMYQGISMNAYDAAASSMPALLPTPTDGCST